MLEILDNNEESNLNNADFPKSPFLSSYNLCSPCKLCSMQTVQATILDINTNECLAIQVLLANKWYTLKAGFWENMKETHQWIYTYVQNIKGSSGMLHNPPCTLCIKHNHKCCVYKQDSGPHFGGVCSKCHLGGKSCKKVYANSVLLFYQLTCI